MIADDLDFRPGDFHNQLDQLVYAGFPAAADVYDQVVNAWCGGGCDHGVDYVVDEYVVACLTAIAMHYQCAAPDSLTQEVGYDGWMGRRQVLSWTVGIEDTQTDRLNSPQIADGAHIVFRGQF